ncbi:putative PHD finger domain protein [Aspergillus candidus]|uniref:Chromatin modification-related protein n=1 Tax=Aspergillus candidus TaxID=41067 RepID=A0A2I2FJH2_ASPCN|nr:hypothetical protein BDW47DRAFT_134582 [Aspergillus candidus]PLB40776.1 hypothetical protein BDW47DRAFT_134582 [Aspergillus candidus]
MRLTMGDYHDTSGGVILDGPFDPDAQATVTDYIDYTEYLPADLIRSLTLIRGLDERYLDSAQNVHDLTNTYGHLPDLPTEARPDARTLRRDISFQLDRAINARESAYAEACRLYDVVDRHFVRLDCIRQKLEVLPKPSSREPTPPPAPVATGKRRSKKEEERPTPPTRITLRLDGQNNSRAGSARQKSSRTRRSLISADHLIGLHPDSPIASTEHSDAEADSKEEPSESPPAPVKKNKDKRSQRARTSGSAGAQNGGSGMSISNALAMLKPPPEDARPGSPDMPWLRLTEWEMTKLRKKMKKNAIWQPSEVMIHRELALRGRGWEAYRAAKMQAEATGTEFIDCDDIKNTYPQGKSGEGGPDLEGIFETKLSNRGMKLNEAKKLKRENQAREQAAAAAAAEAAIAKGLPIPPMPAISVSPTKEDKSGRPTRKRRREDSPLLEIPEVETRSALRSSAKRRRGTRESPTPPEINVSTGDATVTTSTTTVVPVAATEQPSEARPSPPQPSPTGSKRSTSIARVKEGPTITTRATGTPPTTQTPSRRRSAAASAEPVSSVIAAAGRELRRKSATPARRTPVPEAPTSVPGRRRKRPAPGPVSSGQNGGAAVSYGRRKAKPTKKRVSSRDPGSEGGQTREDIRIDEDGVVEEIDPHEPRYCLCGDVSFGTMICCENQDCDREWFHLHCVGLSEVPSRTAKWYCPDCRVRFNKGTDGIIKTGLRR